MEQLNRVELRGIVGTVVLQNAGGNNVARATMVTNRAYKDRNGTAVIETEWHNIVAWEGKYIDDLSILEKGARIYVSGRIHYNKFTGNDGVDHYSTEIIANRIALVECDDELACDL